MKAAVVTRFGPPQVVEIREVPAPVPADNEVLIRVHASTVCYGDWIIRSGPAFVRLMQGFRRRPRYPILGVDCSGVVESVGKGVTRFAPGDEVFGSRGDKFGAHAEFATIAETGFLAHKPANMTLEDAGSLFVGGCCALYFLRKAQIQPGERVLVHGASGSLGTFAVQLARHFGAHVTGVCGPSNVALVKSLGADEVIDYTAREFVTSGPTYDVICDVLGKAGFPRSLRALKPGGRYQLIGFSGGAAAITNALFRGGWAHLRGTARFLAGPAAPVPGDLLFLKQLIEAGHLRTVISRRYPLQDIVAAHAYAESGHKVGNVLVTVR